MYFSFLDFNHRFRDMFVCITLLVYSLNVLSKAEGNQLYGSWRGTIGKAQIYVCFKNDFPSFYHLEKRQGSILEVMQSPQQGSKTWQIREGHFGGDPSQILPMWTISLTDKSTLAGKRTDTRKKKTTQLIRLEKTAEIVKATEEFGAHARDDCAANFYEPLIQASTITNKDKSFANKAYTEIRSKYGTSFLIPNNYPYAEMVNSFNRQLLDAEVMASYDCDVSLNAWNGGNTSAWFRGHFPLVWTEDWLIIRSEVDNYYCGGAHGDSDRSETIIDLQKQKEVDSWSWIKGGEKNANQDRNSSTAFRKLLLKFAKKAATKQYGSSADELDTFFYIGKPYPTSTGLVFTTRLGACRSLDCDIFIYIPFKIIVPYLTRDGASVAESFNKK